MDWFTHGVLPYALCRTVGVPHRIAILLLIGAMAPDLDVFLSWLSLLGDAMYPYGHRGWVHSILIAPIWSLWVWLGLRRLAQRREWAWLPQESWIRAAPWIALGAWSHLVLDGVTIGGVPLFWPISDVNWSAGWFFFMPLAALLVSTFVVGRHVRALWRSRRAGVPFVAWNRRTWQVVLVAFVIALSATGAVRLASAPSGEAWPAPLMWRWYTLSDAENGTREFTEDGWGRADAPMWFRNVFPEAASAHVEACQQSLAYRAWRWEVIGPIATFAEPAYRASHVGPDQWIVQFTDVLGVYTREARPGAAWGEPPNLRCTVEAGRVLETERAL